jgi:hypothetical protein
VALSVAFWNSWGGPRFTRERVSTYREIDARPTLVSTYRDVDGYSARVSTYRDIDGRHTRIEQHEISDAHRHPAGRPGCAAFAGGSGVSLSTGR